MMSFIRVAEILARSRQRLRLAGVESARRDAEVLVGHALGLTRAGLHTRATDPVPPEMLASVDALVSRRCHHEPVAYMLGVREFWSLDIEVGPGVLIPRPESERLVEACLARLSEPPPGRVLELCTGSGAIAIALARELTSTRLIAADVSAEALEFARRNVRRHGLSNRIELRVGDLFEPVEATECFDAIVANPPYVAAGDLPHLMPDVRDFEPGDALVSGADGLDLIRRLVTGAPDHLEAGGLLAFEHAANQADTIVDLLSSAGFSQCEIVADLAGRPRVALARA